MLGLLGGAALLFFLINLPLQVRRRERREQAAALPNDAEPPQQLALQGRWFEHCRQHTPQALIHQLAIALGRDGAAEPEFTRVGGAALCETCGTSYYNHPRHPFYSCLTIACDGRILKT